MSYVHLFVADNLSVSDEHNEEDDSDSDNLSDVPVCMNHCSPNHSLLEKYRAAYGPSASGSSMFRTLTCPLSQNFFPSPSQNVWNTS